MLLQVDTAIELLKFEQVAVTGLLLAVVGILLYHIKTLRAEAKESRDKLDNERDENNKAMLEVVKKYESSIVLFTELLKKYNDVRNT